jgi:hypothetical protein
MVNVANAAVHRESLLVLTVERRNGRRTCCWSFLGFFQSFLFLFLLDNPIHLIIKALTVPLLPFRISPAKGFENSIAIFERLLLHDMHPYNYINAKVKRFFIGGSA